MKSQKINFVKYLVTLIGIIGLAGLLTFAAHLYERQNMPDCSGATPLSQNNNPSHELTFCDQYAMTPDAYKDDFYKRGWPYAYNTAPPERNTGDPDLDKLHQLEYEQQKQAAIGANFVIYLGALTTIYILYSFVRTRYAHHRH